MAKINIGYIQSAKKRQKKRTKGNKKSVFCKICATMYSITFYNRWCPSKLGEIRLGSHHFINLGEFWVHDFESRAQLG